MKYSVLSVLICFSISSCHKNIIREQPKGKVVHKQLRVAIIDTGLNFKDPNFSKHLCPSGHKNFVVEESMKDMEGHGTCIASIIETYAGKSDYCLLIYKFYSKSVSSAKNIEREALALSEAVKNDADIVNLSAGGPGFSDLERDTIKDNDDTVFSVCAGNEGQNLDIAGNEYYPASLFYDNIFPIGSIDKKGKISKFSNYGKKIKIYEVGEDVKCLSIYDKDVMDSGTSMATAIFTGKLIDKLSKTNKNGVNDVHKLGF